MRTRDDRCLASTREPCVRRGRPSRALEPRHVELSFPALGIDPLLSRVVGPAGWRGLDSRSRVRRGWSPPTNQRKACRTPVGVIQPRRADRGEHRPIAIPGRKEGVSRRPSQPG
jgi:hypothetical protein